ncbi:50S ribosomal protein L19, partial [Candidatus Collierbacteria bacterium]|nr:50S ribosomal protein L19 [Candidatus Collierbacteria bacterium]
MANQLIWKDNLTFGVGDTIRVHQTITEADKTRTQIFEGVVISIKGHDGLKSFVVRKIASNNVGVEKIFPALTPTISKIELKKKGKVNR